MPVCNFFLSVAFNLDFSGLNQDKCVPSLVAISRVKGEPELQYLRSQAQGPSKADYERFEDNKHR